MQPLVVEFAASLGMFTFRLLQFLCHFIFHLFLRLYSFSLCVFAPFSRIVAPFFCICCPPSFCHVCPFRIHIHEPFSSAFPSASHVSLVCPPFPASYISLMLSTSRSQPSTMPSIRPWASDGSSKVLFLLVFSIPAHMTSLGLAVGLCSRYTSLNPRRLAVRPLPSSTMTSRLCHYNQRKGRICKFGKSRCFVSLESS